MFRASIDFRPASNLVISSSTYNMKCIAVSKRVLKLVHLLQTFYSRHLAISSVYPLSISSCFFGTFWKANFPADFRLWFYSP